MLTLNAMLPPAALISTDAGAMVADLTACGASWYLADPDALECGEDLAITGWRSQTGGPMATPVAPNLLHSRYESTAALAGLRFAAETNCGFTVPAITGDAARFSVAVRYAARPGAMRTLVTLNLATRRNYLFLTEAEGQISFKSQDNSGGVAVSSGTSAAARWVVAGYSGGQYSLSVSGGPVVSSGPQTSDIGGAGDLFIGCRSHRAGLLKTLGDGVIAEVMFWPVNILDDRDTGARALRAAFEGHALWCL